MLNFRKLKQDFSPAILKKGKELCDKQGIASVKILQLTPKSVRLNGKVSGNFENNYESEVEIDRLGSSVTDSNCDCPYNLDCQHLAALLFYLEEHLDELVVAYSQEGQIEQAAAPLDAKEKKALQETIEKAATKEVARRDKRFQQELLEEYVHASDILSRSPFFLRQKELQEDRADLLLILSSDSTLPGAAKNTPHLQLALRLPGRSKPLHISNIKEFLDSVNNQEPLHIGGKRYFFTPRSFEAAGQQFLEMIMDDAKVNTTTTERNTRMVQIEPDTFGTILAKAFELAMQRGAVVPSVSSQAESCHLPFVYYNSLETPLTFSPAYANIHFDLECVEMPAPKILLKPMLLLKGESVLPEQSWLFQCAEPGLIHQNTYYRFPPHIRRSHLRHINTLREVTIPEPLFGTFVENALPELLHFANVGNRQLIERFVTLPHGDPVRAKCKINYLNGELEANLFFMYRNQEIPAADTHLDYKHIQAFVTPQGILARDLAEEKEIVNSLFQDFAFDPKEGTFVAKTEKKIVEFMTEILPRFQDKITFECPENLLDQFVYDKTKIRLHLKEGSSIANYLVEMEVDGELKGFSLDLLWDCLASNRAYVELNPPQQSTKPGLRSMRHKAPSHRRILVLDLPKLTPIVQLLDEIGLRALGNYKEERPLWSLAAIQEKESPELSISFSPKLREIQEQLLGKREFQPSAIPKNIKANLRNYQLAGVHWLERLRLMHLNGILADDMGLGKTLQAIVAITQAHQQTPQRQSLIVCPTSLVYNWKAEFAKFNPNLRILVIDGIPNQRKKLIEEAAKYDILVTSYSLLQKDIEHYQALNFLYVILDEAQHIKNRTTRNAKSVKMLNSAHRLILTGTPIENSLEELWSLFDFLMPGLLGSYDRFIEKYMRYGATGESKSLDPLRQKVAPFVLRRMKKDVLEDLPPVSEIVYHCQLSELQEELYRSYAKSAREELSRLVERDGFEKIKIHVLATLTRLKQICCHPGIFAKDTASEGDSGKYDMLKDLVQSLIDSKHKTVIFSQYTRMLNIMRDDLKQMGVPFSYLDGSTKNRLDVVNTFNEDPNIPVFLVSLKAGGSGLNLTGADTIIHYDIWWNPAVESQATDRVHRLGQKRAVSSYKLITLGTIEEKIVQLQSRKKGLVQSIVSSDEEALTKLTWEEVLELLQA